MYVEVSCEFAYLFDCKIKPFTDSEEILISTLKIAYGMLYDKLRKNTVLILLSNNMMNGRADDYAREFHRSLKSITNLIFFRMATNESRDISEINQVSVVTHAINDELMSFRNL
ncbi:hypothetical protein RF11_10915 [Thelohanellus kitauei]|uniref:Uncharacterized protein n=1 Tax=Thelohanellus kitauei TaxID=669202 RepID=A0A0C2NJE2_THEKT|nr:hypothetical protein RF11_10915 [Thelohanellus kitauei]